MGHITLIHGLANKPAHDVLAGIWLGALRGRDGSGLDLAALGISSEMVYWADVLYEKPAETATEGDEVPRSFAEGESRDAEPAETWLAELSPEERAFAASLRQRVEAAAVSVRGEMQDDTLPQAERAIPLPGPIERLLMGKLVRDAHHFLYDKELEPRPGERFRVQKELRDRFVAAVKRGAGKPGPHVVISHSMGTMIAYDCLRRVPECPKVDALLTLGSPLGLSEVQDGWGKTWQKDAAFPADRLAADRWLNFYDRLDVVCAADPKLARDYRRQGEKAVSDRRIHNVGTWRHSVVEYLARDQVRDALRELLGL